MRWCYHNFTAALDILSSQLFSLLSVKYKSNMFLDVHQELLLLRQQNHWQELYLLINIYNMCSFHTIVVKILEDRDQAYGKVFQFGPSKTNFMGLSSKRNLE